ncbi:hypothetical protein Dimus_015055 [Dionaea muscipula]
MKMYVEILHSHRSLSIARFQASSQSLPVRRHPSIPMAASLSLLSAVHPHHRRSFHFHYHPTSFKPLQPPYAAFPPPNSRHSSFLCRHKLTLPFAVPGSSSSESFPFPETQLTSGRFLTPEELDKLQFLEHFTYSCKLDPGYLRVRVMRDAEIDITAKLLAESFGQSMVIPIGYTTLLGYLVKQYLIERRSSLPYAVTLLGFYREEEDGEGRGEEGEVLAGTVELSFDRRGANPSPLTPTPPKDSPYICNMTVKDTLRRRGIGWHLLKASEELISLMSSSREIYLHCRMIDSAPFSMYVKAGYDIVKTDSLFILLTFQRRKHLMYKRLPNLPSEVAIVGLDKEVSS